MEELSREGREAIDALREVESPAGDAVADGLSRLQAEIGTGLEAPLPTGGAGSAGWSLGLKLLVGTGVVGALAAGLMLGRPDPAPPSTDSAVAAEERDAVVSPPPRVDTDPPAPVVEGDVALPPDEVPEAAPEEAPAVEPAPKKATPKNKPSTDEGSNLEEELRLVRGAATASSKGDNAGAMKLLDEHKRRFPRGALAGERELTRAKTLCAMGKTEKARKVADRYLRRHAKSHLAPRFAEVCK